MILLFVFVHICTCLHKLILLPQEFECRPEAEVTCVGAFHVGCGVDGGGGGSGGGRAAAASAAAVVGVALFALSSSIL